MFSSLSITAGLYFSTFSQFLFCSLCGTAFPADRQSMEPQRSRCATVAATSSQLTCASAASGNVQNGCWTDLLFAKIVLSSRGKMHPDVADNPNWPHFCGSTVWAPVLDSGTRLRLGPDSESFFVETVLRHARERTSPAPLNEHVLDCFFKIDGLVQVYKLRFWKSYFVEPRDLAHFIWSVTSSGVMDTHNTPS